jgi:hypothetical protein
MAARMNINKLLDEIKGFAEISNRQAFSRHAPPFCLELRARSTKLRLPRQRIDVWTDLKDLPDVPHPVKITHLGNKPAGPPIS